MTELLRPVSDVAEGLALEAGLFEGSEPVVQLWQAEARALVCPRVYRSRAGFEEAVAASADRGWPVHLRRTGGGTVPQGPGVLNLCMASGVPRGFTIEDGYRLIAGVIAEVCTGYGLHAHTGATPGSFCDGTWNLSLEGRKFVGTAQRWRSRGGRQRMLAHALILTGGAVGPGAAAVDAFHQGLGLDPVRAEVHTTLAEALGDGVPELAALANALHEAASHALHGLAPPA